MTITNKNQKIKSHYSSFYQNINIIFPNITGELKRDYDELEKEKEYFAYDKAIAGDKLEKYKNLTVTRLAQGIPIGGEVHYLDENTLNTAFQSRKKIV